MNTQLPEFTDVAPEKVWEYLFDRLPVGTAVIDLDYRLRRCNPTWAEFIGQYTPSAAADVVPGVSLFDLEPGTEAVLKPLFEPAFAGETVRQEGLRLESGGIVSYWDVVLVPLEINGQVVAVLDVSMDATNHVLNLQAQAEINQRLERQVIERTHEIEQRHQELEALYKADEEIYQHLELDDVLQSLVEVAVDVLKADKSSLMVWNETKDQMVVRAAKGFLPETLTQMRFKAGEGSVGQVVETGKPAIVSDSWQDEQVITRITEAEGIRSFMHFPITIGEQIFGVFNVDYTVPRTFSAGEQRLFSALAQRAALAIENAQLYQKEQQRRQESERRRQVAEALRGIVRVLNSSRPLPEILSYIVAQAAQLMDADICTLHQIDYQQKFVRIEASFGLPESIRDINGFPLLCSKSDELIMKRKLVAVANEIPLPLDPQVENNLDECVRRWRAALVPLYPAYLAVPLVVADEVYGSLAFHFAEARPFPQETIDLAVSLSDQAALAIDNAHLRQQAGAAAVVEERNRLARDLHDAVTQTLFSAGLIADVLPRIWERSPEAAMDRLQELRELTRGALAEMRTLLLELRPATLTETSLGELLKQLQDAFVGRSRLSIDLHIEEERPLPSDVQVALYRIVQEALNNVSKHAGASRVTMGLQFDAQAVTLTVVDNGRGFDPNMISANSLGLGIMQERAHQIGADLKVNSEIGAGTTIIVNCPIQEKNEDE